MRDDLGWELWAGYGEILGSWLGLTVNRAMGACRQVCAL